MNRAGSAPGLWSRVPHSARTSSTRSALTHSVSTPSRTSPDNPAHGCISSIMPTATCHATIVRSPQATALGAGREVADHDVQAGLAGQLAQAGLPGPGPVAVRSAGIGGDQQHPGTGVVVPAAGGPPAAQGLDRELGGVVIDPDADPPGVTGQVIYPVRN